MAEEIEKQGIIYSKQTKPSLKDTLTIIVLILLVVALGTLAINQTLEYFYKSRFLQTPCSLCKELNPGAPIMSLPGNNLTINPNQNINNLIPP
jgi:hypothetical protein